MIIPCVYLSGPIGQMVMDGNGVDSIGTCHTEVITGFAAQPLKHWDIPMADNTKPDRTMPSHKSLDKRLFDVPRKEIPCNVEVVEKVLRRSWNDAWLSNKKDIIIMYLDHIA